MKTKITILLLLLVVTSSAFSQEDRRNLIPPDLEITVIISFTYLHYDGEFIQIELFSDFAESIVWQPNLELATEDLSLLVGSWLYSISSDNELLVSAEIFALELDESILLELIVDQNDYESIWFIPVSGSFDPDIMWSGLTVTDGFILLTFDAQDWEHLLEGETEYINSARPAGDALRLSDLSSGEIDSSALSGSFYIPPTDVWFDGDYFYVDLSTTYSALHFPSLSPSEAEMMPLWDFLELWIEKPASSIWVTCDGYSADIFIDEVEALIDADSLAISVEKIYSIIDLLDPENDKAEFPEECYMGLTILFEDSVAIP